MSRSDAWMPLYVADYLRDTTHLSAEQHGAYLLLIMGAWTRGGVLPADDAQLAAIARMPAPAWRKARGVVMAFFTAGPSSWEHKRIRAELERAAAISEKRRNAGAKGGDAKAQNAGKPLANAKQTCEQKPRHAGVAPPSPLPPPSEVSVVANAPTALGDSDPDTQAWALVRTVLTKQGGLTQKQASSFFGGLLKRHGLRPSEMLVSLIHAEDVGTLDPQSYLSQAAQNLQRGNHVQRQHPAPVASGRAEGRRIWADLAAEERAAGVGRA